MTLDKVSLVYDRLLERYGRQYWWPIVEGNESRYLPEYSNREKTGIEKLEIAIGAVLTQNTSWKNAEQTLLELKKKGVLNLESLLCLSHDEIAVLIKKSGYYNQKAKKIKELVGFIQEKLSGRIEQLSMSGSDKARNELLSLWGIGRETADSILLYAYDMPFFVIDAYTRRIFYRTGLIDGDEEYDDLRFYIESSLPKDIAVYKEYHGLLVEHGKIHCRKTPSCRACPLADICVYYESNAM